MAKDKKKKTKGGQRASSSVPGFLLKVYDILESKEYSDIICWSRDGQSFLVKSVTDFSEKVLPQFFKHNNFASFVRQLNMYDFHKTRTDTSENEFRHKLFKRGHKQLLSEIKRKTSEGAPVQNQIIPYDRAMDLEKLKREHNSYTKDLSVLKTRQYELEKVTKMIYNQNNQLIKENKMLWNELIKNKEKYEKKIEKLMFFVFSVMQQNSTRSIEAAPRQIKEEHDQEKFMNQMAKNDSDEDSSDIDKSSNELRKKKSEKRFHKFMDLLKNKDESQIDSLLDMVDRKGKDSNMNLNNLYDDAGAHPSYSDDDYFEQPKKKYFNGESYEPIIEDDYSYGSEPRKQTKPNGQNEYNAYNYDMSYDQTPKYLDKNGGHYNNEEYKSNDGQLIDDPEHAKLNGDYKYLNSPNYSTPDLFGNNGYQHSSNNHIDSQNDLYTFDKY